MPVSSVQFAIATHILVALAFCGEQGANSARLADSVNTGVTFIRKSVSALAKAGLVKTTRGRHGTTRLAVPATRITLRDVSLALGYPSVALSHQYAVCPLCPVSVNLRGSLRHVEAALGAAIMETLSHTTIAQLAADVRRQAAIESRRGASRPGGFCRPH
jgi:DNA-binding IscR family transcriptional regulator